MEQEASKIGSVMHTWCGEVRKELREQRRGQDYIAEGVCGCGQWVAACIEGFFEELSMYGHWMEISNYRKGHILGTRRQSYP